MKKAVIISKRSPIMRIPALQILAVGLFFIFSVSAFAIGPNFDYYTKVKFEYQYSDYLEYSWPSALEYAFGAHYQQPNPLLASFPEHRMLTKITQAFGPDTELQLMYHYSSLGEYYFVDDLGTRFEWSKDEALYNSMLTYKVRDNISVRGTAQYSVATGNQLDEFSPETGTLTGWMFDLGCDYDFAGFFKIEPSVSIFLNELDGTSTNAQSYNLKLRQALGSTTAAQVKYSYFNTDPVGGQPGLKYHTVTWWLSQWFPTQTAAHLIFRYHVDNLEAESMGPGLEISQYLDWATILTLSYRNYIMTNDDPESSFSKTVMGDKFTSDAYSILITRNLWNDTDIAFKYRYYTTNQNVRMNTYLFSIEQVF